MRRIEPTTTTLAHRSLLLIAVTAMFCGASRAEAQASASSVPASAVTGIVYDSIAGKPLAGAKIELLSANQDGSGPHYAAESDSSGRFRISDVVPGRYYAGFFHQVLDTIGIEARDQVVDIADRASALNLAVPSAHTIASTLCKPDTGKQTLLLLGHLRRANDESSVIDGTVAARWIEPRIVDGRAGIAEYGTDARTGADGFFYVCGIPSTARIELTASKGADSSSEVAIRIPPASLRHVTLYLGAGNRGVPETGIVTGRVHDSTGTPISGILTIDGTTTSATSSASGAFTIDHVPLGTRTMLVRAIGYGPQEVIVHVLGGRTSPLDITLERAVVLPTVETRAMAESKDLTQFNYHRRMSAGGFFVTPTRLEGYAAMQSLHGLIAGLPGLSMGMTHGEYTVNMQRPNTYLNLAGATVACEPRIFVNGVQTNMSFGELDIAYDAEMIAGVEVYTRNSQIPSTYPPAPGHPCGLISIWMRNQKK